MLGDMKHQMSVLVPFVMEVLSESLGNGIELVFSLVVKECARLSAHQIRAERGTEANTCGAPSYTRY